MQQWQRDKFTDKPHEQCSALDLANEIKAYDSDKAWQRLAEEFEEKGVEGMNGKMKPREAIQNLKNAKLRGEDAVGLSMKRTSLLFFESRRGSLDATMSHLKAWRFFAMTVLCYLADCALPPR